MVGAQASKRAWEDTACSSVNYMAAAGHAPLGTTNPMPRQASWNTALRVGPVLAHIRRSCSACCLLALPLSRSTQGTRAHSRCLALRQKKPCVCVCCDEGWATALPPCTSHPWVTGAAGPLQCTHAPSLSHPLADACPHDTVQAHGRRTNPPGHAAPHASLHTSPRSSRPSAAKFDRCNTPLHNTPMTSNRSPAASARHVHSHTQAWGTLQLLPPAPLHRPTL
jgi:hypothetical protein